MKYSSVRAAVLFLVVGLWSGNAFATYGYSWAGGYISYFDGPEIGEGISNLGAYAYLSTANDDYEQSVSDPYWASAEVYEDWNYGYGQVGTDGFPSGDAEAYVEIGDESYATAIGRATAELGFIFDTPDDQGGQISVGMDYWYGLDVSADNPGNWAHGDVLLSLILRNITTGEESISTIEDYLDAAEGDGWYTEDYSTIDVSLFFNEGDEGMLLVDAYTFADASSMSPATVPAPAAVMLGSLGLGLVGWLRRRQSL